LVLDMPWEQIVAGLQDASMQSRIGVVPGLNGATILDDTYNASPASCQAALDLLADVPAGERVAVFGDMAELGPIEEAGHRVVGRAAAAVVDRLIVVGRKARWIADAARETNALLPIICTETNHEAAAALRPLLKQNMVVLVKGARVARTEAIVAALRGGEDTHREA
jgi:UDP-N-acetylmuramoyl-tripeptide--D-alanyl-D-alanine ligase